MSTVYAVIIEDRHCDVDVEVWADEQKAIARARNLALKYCRRKEDYQEHDYGGDDWLFYADYSVENDCVRVVRRELRE